MYHEQFTEIPYSSQTLFHDKNIVTLRNSFVKYNEYEKQLISEVLVEIT